MTAFGPATVANVAVGFDILGFAFDGPGDRVAVTRDPKVDGVVVESITGVVTDLPRDPVRNTASVALLSLLREAKPGFGFRVSIDKGIALGSGMGGSAASAVAAVVAGERLLDTRLSRERMLVHCLEGERAASGAAHADNAAACLYGGLVAVIADTPEVVELPLPDGISCVVVHPHLRIDTRDARAVLPREIALSDHVAQSMKLAGFLAGCYGGDTERIRRSMVDLLVEPARSKLIPGFAAAQAAAREAGALGLAIAGSGPSVFAWVDSNETAARVEAEVRQVFARNGVETDGWVGSVRRRGASVENDG